MDTSSANRASRGPLINAPDVVTGWATRSVEGKQISVFSAEPHALQRTAIGVILGFELFGITDYVKSVAERLAAVGYRVAVPDYYFRVGERRTFGSDATGRDDAFEALATVDRPAALAATRAAIDALEGCLTIGFLGLSVGGHIGLAVAPDMPIHRVAAFYPTFLNGDRMVVSGSEPTMKSLGRLGERPVLLFFGSADALCRPDYVAEIEMVLGATGVPHRAVTYPGAAHGFACKDRPSYNADADADSWQQTLSFLAGGS
jgi:carboxymethylenebutenolidase